MKALVLASGAGTNFRAVLDAISIGVIHCEIASLVVDRAGTGAEEIARQRGIPVVCLDHKTFASRADFESALANAIADMAPDFVLALGFMRILPTSLVSQFPNRIINIHPSLLPAFPGLSAQKQALDYGVKLTGVTVHFVDASVDTCPIIAQTSVPVPAGIKLDELKALIRMEEHKIIVDTVSRFCRGQISVDGRTVLVSVD